MQHNLLPLAEFVTRREQLLAKMPSDSVCIIASSQEVTRSNDTEYPFCQAKHFFYLTGFNEPDALLLLVKTAEHTEQILFCREKDELAEIWQGRRYGAEAAKQAFAFDACYTNAERKQIVTEKLANKQQVWQLAQDRATVQPLVDHALKLFKTKAHADKKAPTVFVDCAAIVSEMRLIKSAAELEVMRKVSEISSNAHQRAIKSAKAGLNEYQLEAEIQHEFAFNGARHVAYGSIVAGGDNANILHYTDNNQALNDGDLILIDAGGELSGYAADITRTFPVNGKFTQPQAELYNLVLKAQNAAIDQIKVGQSFATLNALVCDVLTEGLHQLGILQGDLTELKQQKACKKYFIHGLGHWLGLDVHDVGDYQVDSEKQQQRPFEVGMVMTIEPGLYMPMNDETIAAQYRGIGIRIEDNIVVTEQGYENLTTAVKTVADIEALMAK